MSDTEARALLRRLVEAHQRMNVAGNARVYGNEDISTYSDAVACFYRTCDEARALLAEPEGENDLTIRVPDAFSRLPLEQWVEFTAKLYRNADGTLLMDGESVTSTPRSRAEAEAMVAEGVRLIDALNGIRPDTPNAPVKMVAWWVTALDWKRRAALLAALTTEGM